MPLGGTKAGRRGKRMGGSDRRVRKVRSCYGSELYHHIARGNSECAHANVCFPCFCMSARSYTPLGTPLALRPWIDRSTFEISRTTGDFVYVLHLYIKEDSLEVILTRGSETGVRTDGLFIHSDSVNWHCRVGCIKLPCTRNTSPGDIGPIVPLHN